MLQISQISSVTLQLFLLPTGWNREKKVDAFFENRSIVSLEMDHIIQNILQHILYLSDANFISEADILEQLIKEAAYDQIPRPEIFQGVFDIQRSRVSKEKEYHVILFNESADLTTFVKLGKVNFLPFGIWRYSRDNHRIGQWNSYSYHWKAYMWSSQKHKTIRCYEDLDPQDRCGLVAEGHGNTFKEYYSIPPHVQQSRKEENTFYGYLDDAVAMSLYEKDYKKQNPDVRIF